MNNLMTAIMALVILTTQAEAQVITHGNATVETSKYSKWVTFQVHGNAAKSLYSMLQIDPVNGVKRGPGITCVEATDQSYYCSMSVNPEGEVEGDGISSPQPNPGVSLGNR